MFKEITVTMTPKQEKVLQEVHDFWHQDAKDFLFQEIKIELTPAQQQFKDDLNDFLHIELTWQDFKDFLFQDITFGKKNKNN